MLMKRMIAVPAFVLFAAIGLAGNPGPAAAQEGPPMTMAPIAPDADAVCGASSEIKASEARETSISNECRQDCWDGYLFCLEFALPSQCLPGYHDCLDEC